jgi:hypothetical protein
MYKVMRESLESGNLKASFHDISDVFNSVEEPLYTDRIHITDKGNAIVAAEIFKLIKGAICRDRPENLSERTATRLVEACLS